MKIIIQGVLLVAIAGFLIVFVRGQNGVRMQAGKRLAFVAFLLLNAYAVVRPEDTTWVAKHIFGIGRGADLLLYALIVTFVFAVINFYLRVRDSEQRVTELARAVAIRDAELLNRERGLLPPTIRS
jgi:hypothetical protein